MCLSATSCCSLSRWHNKVSPHVLLGPAPRQTSSATRTPLRTVRAVTSGELAGWATGLGPPSSRRARQRGTYCEVRSLLDAEVHGTRRTAARLLNSDATPPPASLPP